MLTTETIATFFTASILLGMAPGPDNLFVLTQSALHGRAAGLFVVLGLCTGLLVHTSAVAFGVAAVFQASATAFSALKFIGAGYLLYLAWQAFRAKPAHVSSKDAGAPASFGLYRRGILMNITNPKVSIFFLAFLPQFADPARGSVTMQMMLLGGIFIISTILVFGTIAIVAGSLRAWLLKSDRAQTTLNKVAGVVFIALALKLATARR
jgi:threonine/homoserine/homoserine lactone efflux protein